MANAVYDKGREAFLSGGINWGTGTAGDNIKAVLVDTGAYTLNIATHQFLSDIAAGARISTSANFAGKTTTSGVADANDLTFTAVTGASCEALVIYKDTGTATTSALITFMDTATGLPVTPNGGDITVTFDNGTNKIFKL
jgi:hypothetical protein